MKVGPLVCAATLSLAVAASGCGGDDEKGGPETEAITKAAKTVITDPEKSCDTLTANALSVFTGGATGSKAAKKCKKQVADDKLPKTAEITVLSTKGDGASVGYTTADVTGAMVLVKTDGKWLMDRVTTVPGL